MCVSAVLHRRAEPGDKNLSLLSVFVLWVGRQGTCQKAVLLAVLLEACEGKKLGAAHGWTMKMGKQHWSVPVTGSAIKVVENLHYSCSSTALVEVSHVCAMTGYTSVLCKRGAACHCIREVWTGMAIHQYSDPGAVWAAIKAQLALASLLPIAL